MGQILCWSRMFPPFLALFWDQSYAGLVFTVPTKNTANPRTLWPAQGQEKTARAGARTRQRPACAAICIRAGGRAAGHGSGKRAAGRPGGQTGGVWTDGCSGRGPTDGVGVKQGGKDGWRGGGETMSVWRMHTEDRNM